MAEKANPTSDIESRQEQFDRQARRLGLRVQRRSFAVGEHQDVGFFLALSAGEGTLLKTDAEPVSELSEQDLGAITETLHGWEACPLKEVVDTFTEYTTEPFVVAAPTWIETVDQETLAEKLDSPEAGELLEKFPPFHPRQVELSGLHIAPAGTSRAAASYTVHENFQNGNSLERDGFAFLYKLVDTGWRIAIVSHDPLGTSDE